MSSIKAILRKKANKEGLFPIVIRITKKGNSSFQYTGQYIDEKFWDTANHRVKKSHSNSTRLNNLIIKKLAEVNEKYLEVITGNEEASVQNIKAKLEKDKRSKDFFFVAEIHLSNLKNRNNLHQVKTEEGRLKVFKKFIKSEHIALEDINTSLLKRFQGYLTKTSKIAPRTIANYLILIRTIYNIAISEDLVDRKYYPFGKGKIQIKIPESEKIGLNEEEVSLLENCNSLSDAQQHALNVWLFSFYFAGMRIGDVLQTRWSDFIDSRLHYRMNKNQKLVTLKTPDKAQLILNKYKGLKNKKDDFIFPEMKKADMRDPNDVLTKTQTATRKFNRHLKNIAEIVKINKPLSCHISRHSFASIAGQSINIQTLQKLYRHNSITTTINYQNSFIHKDFDDALDSVINF